MHTGKEGEGKWLYTHLYSAINLGICEASWSSESAGEVGAFSYSLDGAKVRMFEQSGNGDGRPRLFPSCLRKLFNRKKNKFDIDMAHT